MARSEWGRRAPWVEPQAQAVVCVPTDHGGKWDRLNFYVKSQQLAQQLGLWFFMERDVNPARNPPEEAGPCASQ